MVDFDGGAAIERFPAEVNFRFNFPNSNVVIEFVFSCLKQLPTSVLSALTDVGCE